MRGRLTTVTATLAAVGALALSSAPSALAAHGEFGYHDENGEALTLNNPQEHHCYELRGVGPARNRTNQGAWLFRGPGCYGSYTVLSPQEERPVWFGSVIFG